jgi:hypothetical protein
MGASFLSLWAHTKCCPMWAQRNCHGCKIFASVGAHKNRCKNSASAGAHKMSAYVGAKFLLLWAQHYCLCGRTDNVCLCGHKNFASMSTKLLPPWVHTFCLCRCTQNVSLCGHKTFASMCCALAVFQSPTDTFLGVGKLTYSWAPCLGALA